MTQSYRSSSSLIIVSFDLLSELYIHRCRSHRLSVISHRCVSQRSFFLVSRRRAVTTPPRWAAGLFASPSLLGRTHQDHCFWSSRRILHLHFPIFFNSSFNCTAKSSVVSSSSQLSSQRCVLPACWPTSSSFAQSTNAGQLLSHVTSRSSEADLLRGSPRIHRPPQAAQLCSVAEVACRSGQSRIRLRPKLLLLGLQDLCCLVRRTLWMTVVSCSVCWLIDVEVLDDAVAHSALVSFGSKRNLNMQAAPQAPK